MLTSAGQAIQQVPIPWRLVVLAGLVLAVSIGAWLLALRPRDGAHAGVSTPARAKTADMMATSDLALAVAEEATRARTPTALPAPSRTPTPMQTATTTPSPAPTAVPSMTPTETSPPTLSVTVAGSGTVTRIPHKAIYTYRMGVILNPVANHGWSFAGWSGPNASDPVRIQGDTWSLTMDGNKELIAVFAEERFYVVTTIEGEGTVTNSPGNPYVYGQTATLTPLAKPGWSFDSWAGPDGLFVLENLDGTWSLTVDGSKKVTAIFGQDR